MSRKNKVVDEHCCFLVCLNFSSAVISLVGFLDARTVSSTAEFRSFLLTMCIDAPESTANSLSSSFFEDGAGYDQTSESELHVGDFCTVSLCEISNFFLHCVSPVSVQEKTVVSSFHVHCRGGSCKHVPLCTVLLLSSSFLISLQR